MPLLLGLCLDWWGSWDISLMAMAFFYFLSAVCWLGIKADEPLPLA